ncbi:hypothetical protein ACIBJI_23755 [Nocardia sp. NPDC050408]
MFETFIGWTVAYVGLVAIAAAVVTGYSVDKSFTSTSISVASGSNPPTQ